MRSIEDNYHAVADLAEDQMGVSIVFKSESRLMRLISKLLFWMKDDQFMKGFTTTIGSTIYLADRYTNQTQPSAAETGTIAHELVHVEQFDRLGLVGMSLAYLFPQSLALLSLFALLALTGNLWFLLFLLALGFLAPIPAPWRMVYEVEAYAVGYATWHWAQGQECPARSVEEVKTQLGGYLVQFTSWNYYRMWPWGDDVAQRLSEKTHALANHQWSELPETAKRVYEVTMSPEKASV